MQLGSQNNIETANQICPTCKTHLKDSLIQDIYEPMDIETNINYLKSQIEAFDILKISTLNKINKLKTNELKLREMMKNEREILQSLKKDITSSNVISEAIIRETINLENLIKKLELAKNVFDEKIEKLIDISKIYKTNKHELDKLPKKLYSKIDLQKLYKFTEIFQGLLKKYGYSSKKEYYSIQVSFDNNTYKPSSDGFDITLDSSASDNIRVIWAYSVALMFVTHEFHTNHLGFIIFDEPEQQRMKEANSKTLYKTLNSIKINNLQSIVATSEDKNLLNEKVKDIKCNVLELDGRGIVPQNQWLYKLEY